MLIRSVAVDGAEHPASNLLPEASGTNGNYMMTIASTGYLYKIATGRGIAGHLYTWAKRALQIAVWEPALSSNNRAD